MTNDDIIISKKIKLLVLVLFIIISWIAGIYIIHNMRNNWGENIYPNAVLSLYDLEFKDDSFFATNTDPQIYILPPVYKISSTRIELDKPVSTDTRIQIFYAEEENKLSEKDSVIEYLQKGTSNIIINLPFAVYTTLRYDIDIFDEAFKINGIYFSKTNERINSLTGNASIKDILLTLLIINILIIIIFAFCVKIGYKDYFGLLIYNFINDVKKNPLKIVKKIVIMITIFFIAIIIEIIVSRFLSTNGSLANYRILLFSTVGLIFYCLII